MHVICRHICINLQQPATAKSFASSFAWGCFQLKFVGRGFASMREKNFPLPNKNGEMNQNVVGKLYSIRSSNPHFIG